VLEYSEERPPLVANRGMVSNIVNFYRGDIRNCPISAGGGDRPPHKVLSRQRSVQTIEDSRTNSNSFLGPDDNEEIMKQLKLQKQQQKEVEEKREEEVR
jgi:hypothetical protein